mmetsp:Transcript_20113/g.77009  ORF Transcript_20113/g.77009 Transcript_20113/m.77009 type:complete len:1776 (+) Transcript_20113:103-5430(+)
MASARHLLVLLLFVASAVAQLDEYCVAGQINGFDDADFFPTPADVALSTCPDSSGDSCCSAAYDASIAEGQDTIGLIFRQTITDATVSIPCRYALEGISCLMCSPEQTYYAQKNKNDDAVLFVCQDLCDTAYAACGSAYTDYNGAMETVSTAFISGLDFCQSVFEASDSLDVYVSPFSDNCWDNLPLCTLDDYYMVFTDCISGTRDRLWNKKEDSQCSGGVQKPPNEYGLQCAVSCEPGYAIVSQDGQAVCHACTAGHYSLGGGVRQEIWDDWNTLHFSFSTYCTQKNSHGVTHIYTDEPCGWELTGEEANSGDISDDMSSVLETSVTLVADGELIVSYMVDSEPFFDGLSLIVDHVVVAGLISQVPLFETHTYPLTAGYHLIQLVYSKDNSVSRGLDQAAIELFEITNIRYADYSCTPCPAGQYQPETGMDRCMDCDANTFSTGAAEACEACPEGTFAYQGSSECLAADDCTEDDVNWLYGECQTIQGSDDLHRSYYPVWDEPHLCREVFALEDPVWVPCLNCNPGFYRPVGSASCVACPSGSAGDGIHGCQTCTAGTQAIAYEYFYYFDSWNFLNSRGLTTSCEGECGTDGWILHDTYIESGEGHGYDVQSILSLDAELVEDGTLSFTYSFQCEGKCDMRVITSSGSSRHLYGGAWVQNQAVDQTITMVLHEGDNVIDFVFSKDSTAEEFRNDRVIITQITVSHDVDGGAPECVDCPAGSFSAHSGEEVCTPAPAGSYVAEPGSTSATPCPAGTFSSEEGATECDMCGENVDSNDDRTGCDVSCRFDYQGHTYDMLAMARTDGEMYGPVTDLDNNDYYLNACTDQHNNRTCFSGHGTPIDTYACQVAENGVGEDLGNVFGYIPLSEEYGSTPGITLHYTYGDLCLNHTSLERFPRQSFVDVVCQPSAGIGMPAPYNPDGTVETEQCVYRFMWYSLYGCPVCTEDNYYYIVKECEEDVRTIEYHWIENDDGYKMCHDGATLPASIDVPCVNTDIDCPEGYYVDLTDPATASNPQCQPADPGFYSIGGGVVYDSWQELPKGFSAVGWDGAQETYIHSGEGTTSLLYINEWVADGYLEFSYKVYSFGDSTSGLFVYYDSAEVGSIRTYTGADYVTERFSVPAGHHSIQFMFVAGTATTYEERERGARIQWIKAVGLTRAAEFQTPCPPGTYQPDEGQTGCLLCGLNTFSFGAAAQCTDCHHDQYSYLGASECTLRQPCTADDYQTTYTECTGGTTTSVTTLIEPVICIETEDIDGTVVEEDIECQCPPGHYLVGTACLTCPAGKYYSDGECRKSSPGYAALPTTGWFVGPEPGSGIPSDFTTGCSGDCLGGGWVFKADHVDSNANYRLGDIDSWIELAVEYSADGFLTFEYEVMGDEPNGLEVFVNGVQQMVTYHPSEEERGPNTATVLLSDGDNTVRWNYHQERGTSGYATLRNIVAVGAFHGGALQQTQCPPGTSSENSGSDHCTVCPLGTANDVYAATSCNACDSESIAEEVGSMECQECGSLTYSNDDHTDCETTCLFELQDGGVVNLNPLQNMPGPYALESTGGDLSILMNLCSKSSHEFYCIDPFGEPIHTYTCEVDSRGNGVDSGHVLAIEVKEPEEEPAAIVLSYTGGEAEGCEKARQTKLTITCDADALNSVPTETSRSTECALELEWSTIYGCRVCDEEEDYETRESACEDGEQTTTVVRTSDCYGPAIRESKTESCYNYSFTIGVSLIVVLVVLGGILAAVVGFIAWRYRMLHTRYIALVGSQDGQYEMEEMDNDLAEDKKKDDA